MNKLIIIGAGGHGFVIKEIAEECGYSKIDFLDDNSELGIGKIKDLSNFLEYKNIFVSIGDCTLRQELINTAIKLGFNIPTLIHPTAYVSKSATIGKGTVIEPEAIINSNVFIGEGCIISIGSIIDHNATIKDYVQVNAGCIIKSSATLESNQKLEVGQIIYN